MANQGTVDTAAVASPTQAHQKAVAEVQQKVKDLGNATTALEAASTALQRAKNPPRTGASASGFDDGDRRPTGSNRKDVNTATVAYNAALVAFTSASQAALNSKLDLLASDYKEQVAAINARGERAKVPHAAAPDDPKGAWQP